MARSVDDAPDSRRGAPGCDRRRAAAARRPDRPCRVRPGLAGPVRAGSSPHPRCPRRAGAAPGARRFDDLVPGLAAKPRIDILLIVPDSADEPAYVPAMEAAGYVLRIREPEWYEHRVFKGPDTDVNVHVFSPGCPRSPACSCSATGCGPTMPTELGMRRPSATSPADLALMCRTTPMPRRRSWSRSSRRQGRPARHARPRARTGPRRTWNGPEEPHDCVSVDLAISTASGRFGPSGHVRTIGLPGRVGQGSLSTKLAHFWPPVHRPSTTAGARIGGRRARAGRGPGESGAG